MQVPQYNPPRTSITRVGRISTYHTPDGCNPYFLLDNTMPKIRGGSITMRIATVESASKGRGIARDPYLTRQAPQKLNAYSREVEMLRNFINNDQAASLTSPLRTKFSSESDDVRESGESEILPDPSSSSISDEDLP